MREAHGSWITAEAREGILIKKHFRDEPFWPICQMQYGGCSSAWRHSSWPLRKKSVWEAELIQAEYLGEQTADRKGYFTHEPAGRGSMLGDRRCIGDQHRDLGKQGGQTRLSFRCCCKKKVEHATETESPVRTSLDVIENMMIIDDMRMITYNKVCAEACMHPNVVIRHV